MIEFNLISILTTTSDLIITSSEFLTLVLNPFPHVEVQ